MMRVPAVAVGDVPGGDHDEEPGDHERGPEEPGLEVAEVQRVLHLVEDAGQDPAVDGVDQRDQREDGERPSSVPSPVGGHLLW